MLGLASSGDVQPLATFTSSIGAYSAFESTDFDVLALKVRIAFQPIVDIETRQVFAYEALVRGVGGEPAEVVIAAVPPRYLHEFDQACRCKAIESATQLGIQTRLSVNLIPNAMYDPATGIQSTLAVAKRCRFDPEKLIFELTESERIRDTAQLARIICNGGFMSAIDDFGSGYAGLKLLADFQPDLVKLDMGLIRNIDADFARYSITAGIVTTCRALGCLVLAEGVETVGEYSVLRELGISMFQGFLFAPPELEALPDVDFRVWAS